MAETTNTQEPANGVYGVLAPVFDNMTLVLNIIEKYGKSNKSPNGLYHCQIPEGKEFNKWDIVKNKGNSITRGAYYAIVGYLTNADFYNNGHINFDGTKNGYILLRLYDLSVETALIKDWLEPTGLNLIVSLNGC